MDDFTSKLKDAFSFGKGKFKGTAHKLGSSDSSNVKPDNRQNARVDLIREQRLAASGQGSASAGAGASSSRPAATSASPSRVTAAPVDRRLPHPSDEQIRSPPTQPPPQPAAPSEDVMDDVNQCLGMILSSPNAAAAVEILTKVLGNIMNQPMEVKFRTIRLGNPKIEQAVVMTPGALDLLEAIGFHMSSDGGVVSLPISATLAPLSQALHYLKAQQPFSTPVAAPPPSPPPVSTEPFPPLPSPTPLPTIPPAPTPAEPLNAPHTHTAPAPEAEPKALAAPSGASPPASTAPVTVPSAPPAAVELPQVAAPSAPPLSVPSAPPLSAPPAQSPATAAPVRDTQVIMPVTPETQVPDWFFERTPNEVKHDYLTMMRRREGEKVLMTKAQREAAERATSKRPRGPVAATVRVRTPEGVCIQAVFQPKEPVAAVFEWVEGSLRYGGLEYELVGPSRRPLGIAGSVAEADLAPSVLLNLRILGGLGSGGGPLLRDELLAKAEVAWAGGEAGSSS